MDMWGMLEAGAHHFAGGGARASTFNARYKCYSMLMMPGRARLDANDGGKVFMPPQALEQLSRLNIEYPMMFSVSSERGRKTHCGVLEFVADPGMMHMPAWMMNNLAITEGDNISLRNVTLPRGSFAKLQPQSKDFYEISDHRAVLENSLRHFSCLTEGDNFSVNYNSKIYDMVVLEVKPKDPSKAISIIETDLQIDFAPALGMPDEPEYKPAAAAAPVAADPVAAAAAAAEAAAKTQQEKEDELIKQTVFQPFTGGGARLDGKAPKTKIDTPVVAGATSEAARRDAERRARAKAAQSRFTPGKMKFGGGPPAPAPPPKKGAAGGDGSSESASASGDAKPTNSYFSGEGRRLRD